MAIKIILEEEGKKQVEISLDPSEYEDKDWETVCHEKWCSRSLPKPGRQQLSFDMFDSQYTARTELYHF